MDGPDNSLDANPGDAKMIKILLICALLVGCSSNPVTTSVKHNQEYDLPTAFVIHGIFVSRELAESLCGINNVACLVKTAPGKFNMIYSSKETLVHEAKHMAYGPAHK